jgi:predicted ABC-type ATPase
MEGNGRPTLWLIAGANGVGKTTYARARIEAVSGTTTFVNLDLIAQGLSPLDPLGQQIRAARVALEMARDLIADKRSFSLETTLSGKTHLRLVALAKANGMAVKLLYFFVDTPEQCLARVARRVSEGGHDVPEADLRRRYDRSLAHFGTYAGMCDFWRIYDANGRQPVTAAEGADEKVAYVEGAALPEDLAKWLREAP